MLSPKLDCPSNILKKKLLVLYIIYIQHVLHQSTHDSQSEGKLEQIQNYIKVRCRIIHKFLKTEGEKRPYTAYE